MTIGGGTGGERSGGGTAQAGSRGKQVTEPLTEWLLVGGGFVYGVSIARAERGGARVRRVFRINREQSGGVCAVAPIFLFVPAHLLPSEYFPVASVTTTKGALSGRGQGRKDPLTRQRVMSLPRECRLGKPSTACPEEKHEAFNSEW